jgi:hypothetical protein
MSSTDSGALLAAAAALLDQGRRIDKLSRLLTVTALAALVAIAVLGAPRLMVVALLGLSVLAGAVELYLAVRVGFDAALFRRLAEAADAGTVELADLDAALTSMGLLSAGKAGRPLAARVAGACSLLYQQAGSLVLQIALFLLGAVIAALS